MGLVVDLIPFVRSAAHGGVELFANGMSSISTRSSSRQRKADRGPFIKTLSKLRVARSAPVGCGFDPWYDSRLAGAVDAKQRILDYNEDYIRNFEDILVAEVRFEVLLYRDTGRCG